MLDLLKNIEDEYPEKIDQAYKQIFANDVGELVLQDMLWDLFFLQPTNSKSEQALCNYAKTLLAKIYGQEMEYSKLKEIFRKLLKRRIK